MFVEFSAHQYEFFECVGEKVETFLAEYRILENQLPKFPEKVLPIDKFLMTLIWLRSYPTQAVLSLTFNVSLTDVSRTLRRTWPMLYRYFSKDIAWPSVDTWKRLRHNWPTLPGVVGVIDATSHEVQVPPFERKYYSGHRKYNCISTQIVIDNEKNIRCLSSGFYGHMNDAQTYSKIPSMGINKLLPLPHDSWILADGGYPCRQPLITPFRKTQLSNDVKQRQIQELFNTEVKFYRVYVEHVIARLKHFKAIGSIFRNDRDSLELIVHLCASLAQRRVELFDDV